jgi:hypothetical protein
VDGVTDHWCGRLYDGDLPMPTITSVPDGYVGLPYLRRSENDEAFVASLFDDPVPIWGEVLASAPIPRPRQAAVSRPLVEAAPTALRSAVLSATISARAM